MAPWHRLRIGDYRMLYRAVDPGEAADADARWLVTRVVHRLDLERAVSTLARRKAVRSSRSRSWVWSRT